MILPRLSLPQQKRLLHLGLFLAGPAVVLVLWDGIVRFGFLDARLFPLPGTIAARLVQDLAHSDLITVLGVTLGKTLLASALAILPGWPLGLVLGARESLYRASQFLLDFFRAIPAVALFPLAMLILGLGATPKVALAGFSGFLVVAFSVAYGTRHISSVRVLAARGMGASAFQILRDVLFYESLPYAFTGLRLALSIALLVTVVTEMYTGGDGGLGQWISDAQQNYDISKLYEGILCTGLLGYGLNGVVDALRRAWAPWGSR